MTPPRSGSGPASVGRPLLADPFRRASSSGSARVGIVAMLVAMGAFTINDALLKLAAANLPMGQILAFRGLFATAVIAVVALAIGAFRHLPLVRSPLLLVRTLAEVVATFLYLVALFRMPIANIVAINSAVPLATTAGAMLFLGEKVGPRRWAAIAVGFLGILVIVRPGAAGFTVWSLVALAAVFVIALRDLATRRLDPALPGILVTLATAGAVTTLGFALAPFENWGPLSPSEVGLLALSALFLFGGYSFIVIAMRAAEVSAVAPFRYSALLWAVLLQITLFGDPLDLPTLLGAAILVATGLYALRREAVTGKAPVATDAAAQPPV